jgi:hypothetical protein
MTLDQKETKKICDFVRIRPRTVQEISEHLGKNWRTADRYVEKIGEETGFISAKIFREGTRGALKVVYWNLAEEIFSTSFQHELMEEILKSKHKVDFSPFEIYQHVPEKKKNAFAYDASKFDSETEISKEQDLVSFLRQAKNQVTVFSGNLSWINAKQGKTDMLKVIQELVEEGVSIKIIARVSMVGINNVKKLLAINKKFGKDLIEIRHRYQPLRAIIIDEKAVKFREIKDPEHYLAGEIKRKTEIFYDINDGEWVLWLKKIFWKMFSSAMSAEKRIHEIEKIKNADI